MREDGAEQRTLRIVKNYILPTKHDRTVSRDEMVFVTGPFVGRHGLFVFVLVRHPEIGLPVDSLRECDSPIPDFR